MVGMSSALACLILNISVNRIFLDCHFVTKNRFLIVASVNMLQFVIKMTIVCTIGFCENNFDLILIFFLSIKEI